MLQKKMMLVAMERDEIIERVLEERQLLAERVRRRHEAMQQAPVECESNPSLLTSSSCS